MYILGLSMMFIIHDHGTMNLESSESSSEKRPLLWGIFQYRSDWWFGTFGLFSIYWEQSSQLTNTFQRGWKYQTVGFLTLLSCLQVGHEPLLVFAIDYGNLLDCFCLSHKNTLFLVEKRELFSHLVGHFRHLVGNFRRCKMKMVSGLIFARSILSKRRCSCIPFDSHMLSGNGTWQSEMEALMGKSWWNFHCYLGFPGCVHWTWDVPPPPCARRGIYKVSGGVSGGNLEPVQCSPVSGRLN